MHVGLWVGCVFVESVKAKSLWITAWVREVEAEEPEYRVNHARVWERGADRDSCEVDVDQDLVHRRRSMLGCTGEETAQVKRRYLCMLEGRRRWSEQAMNAASTAKRLRKGTYRWSRGWPSDGGGHARYLSSLHGMCLTMRIFTSGRDAKLARSGGPCTVAEFMQNSNSGWRGGPDGGGSWKPEHRRAEDRLGCRSAAWE